MCYEQDVYPPRGLKTASPRLAGLHRAGSPGPWDSGCRVSVLRALPGQRRLGPGAWIRPQWGEQGLPGWVQLEGTWPRRWGWTAGAPVQRAWCLAQGCACLQGPATFLAQKPCRDGRRPRDVLGLISEETRINEKFLCSGALQSRLLPTLGLCAPGEATPQRWQTARSGVSLSNSNHPTQNPQPPPPLSAVTLWIIGPLPRLPGPGTTQPGTALCSGSTDATQAGHSTSVTHAQQRLFLLPPPDPASRWPWCSPCGPAWHVPSSGVCEGNKLCHGSHSLICVLYHI